LRTVDETSRPEFSGEIKKTAENWRSAAQHLVIDSGSEVGRLYGVRFTPTAFVLDPDGKVIYHGALDSSTTEGEKDLEQARSARSYIREALEQAMAKSGVSLPETKIYGCPLKGVFSPTAAR
jgi:hypothetical protein